MTAQPGKTRSTGFQIGVRRTLPVSPDKAWRLVTAAAGRKLWLGEGTGVRLAAGRSYRLADGSSGEVRVVRENSHLRLTWRPRGWERPSTIQVRVIPSGEKTVVAFHQEHLPGPEEREARRRHFAAALDALERRAGGG